MRNGHVWMVCALVLMVNVTSIHAQTINFVYMPPDDKKVGSCYGNCGGGCGGFPDPCGPGGSAHMCIADPLGRQVNLKEDGWSNLFASHPPMAARIAALKGMAYEPGTRGA